ncbi:2-oxo acid dehydrogenase subunit E2 [Saccharicrinis sp. FJH54]|uniref:2-oxo acid dehydrogenase subunit E2 n=1 Tax=Saccharicrinis sp. FJH54 TaxID=3344665 RepID=UPI0035D3E7CD
MDAYKIRTFPKSRIATNDVCAIGRQKHHVTALIEIDVSESREKIKAYKKTRRISFTAWLIKVISITVKDYENATAYLKGKRKIVVFNDINVSLAVEKVLNGQRIPIPVIIEKAHERSIESITQQINEARDQQLADKDIVLQKRTNRLEQIYYVFPGLIRRYFWRYLVRHPSLAFSKMGNIAFTSVGMTGKGNAWFIPLSVHPVCFGISNISRKPVVVDDKIAIREMLQMTVLLDHDVIDGAQMARFLRKLSENIEGGIGL